MVISPIVFGWKMKNLKQLVITNAEHICVHGQGPLYSERVASVESVPKVVRNWSSLFVYIRSAHGILLVREKFVTENTKLLIVLENEITYYNCPKVDFIDIYL